MAYSGPAIRLMFGACALSVEDDLHASMQGNFRTNLKVPGPIDGSSYESDKQVMKLLPAARMSLRLALCALIATSLAAQTASKLWTATVQTGMADTFQLTLGGMFGEGPAWQNRAGLTLSNAVRGGDSLSVYGWNSLDMPGRVHNWQAGIGYRLHVFERRSHSLAVGSGIQRWLFPGVKTGAKDWLVPGNVVLRARIWRFPITFTGDSWSLLDSPLPKGSLLHSQLWVHHPLWKRDGLRVSFRHGPAHTYSWNFYGTSGNRVLRYQSMLSVVTGGLMFEGGYRQQIGLQRGIANNRYWQFAVSHSVTLPWPDRRG